MSVNYVHMATQHNSVCTQYYSILNMCPREALRKSHCVKMLSHDNRLYANQMFFIGMIELKPDSPKWEERKKRCSNFEKNLRTQVSARKVMSDREKLHSCLGLSDTIIGQF